MKSHLAAIAAAALTASVGMASATDLHAKSNAMLNRNAMSKTSAAQSMAKNSLSLTRSQLGRRYGPWRRHHSGSTRQARRAGVFAEAL